MLLDLSDPPLAGEYLRAVHTGWHEPVLYRRPDPEGELTITIARTEQDRKAVEEIINRLYGWRGYGDDHHLTERASSTTFVASRNGKVFGTLTLTVDSPEGLSIDHTFADELGAIRAGTKASLCELTKFAFDPSPQSRPLLAALFHVIFAYGTQRYDCTDLLIEVNPRHVRFYEVMLDFARLGPLRTNEAVNAPSQLMHLQVAHIERQIGLLAGRADVAGHSLYPHFFATHEERMVRQRILGSSDLTSPERAVPWDVFRRAA